MGDVIRSNIQYLSPKHEAVVLNAMLKSKANGLYRKGSFASQIIWGNRIFYFHNPSNPGFGAAHNIAIRLALLRYSTFHLVLNPDVSFRPGTLESIIEFMNANVDIGNVMPKVFFPNGDLQYLCKLLPTPWDWIGRRFFPCKKLVDNRNNLFELRFTGYDKIIDVPYLSGCFMMLRLNVIKEVGFFDEKIFMYGEETDLCRRIINAGFRTVYYPKVSIVHEFAKGSHKSYRLTWIGIRSAVYYFSKWGWFSDTERSRINRATLSRLNIDIR
jgi:GT2 family glycosyltransferase